MRSSSRVLAALLLALACGLAAAQLDHQAMRGLKHKVLKAVQNRMVAERALVSGRSLLATFTAGDYTKCIYESGCYLNPLYLASTEFGVDPQNAIHELMLGYAYQSKNCAAKNGDQAGCNGVGYCEYRSDTSLCQYDGVGAADASDILPVCSDAKINLDSAFGSCIYTTEASCTSASGCTWANSACTSTADQTAIAEFVAYIFAGTGEWKDSWFGTCATGKIIKTVFTTCHGTDQSKCDATKCSFQTGDGMSYCFFKEDVAFADVLGNDDFTKKYLAAANACDAKMTMTDCEADKGPAATKDLSKYSDISKLQETARDKGSAASVTYSVALMAASALAGLMLVLTM